MLGRLIATPVRGLRGRFLYKTMNSQRHRGDYRSSRGTNRRGGFGRQSTSNVPPIRQVVPGAAVSIVLKADQPTGREVQGVVQDVLTSGDHPRGIKVRMTDGRVGRVQRMQSDVLPISVASPAAEEFQVITAGNVPSAGVQRMKYRDVRLDEESEARPTTLDLAAYIKPAKQKKKAGKMAVPVSDMPAQDGLSSVSDAPLAACPVCGQFEGDEAAVAHHVESHFS